MNMFSRAEQKAETRARILEVARALLEREGFEGTNIRAIAAEAKVAPGTVLMHFEGKQALLHTALFEDLARTWRAAKDNSAQDSFETQLQALAGAFFDYYASRPALSRALLRESLFAAPPWSERFAAQVAEVHAHVTALALAAKERGELKANADVGLLGTSFLSFYYFTLLAWLQGGHPNPVRLFEAMLTQHLDGLRQENERQP